MPETLVRAVADAERFHRCQVRKTTSIPYLSHVLAVCALVLEAGGTETEAVASLLHDAVGAAFGGRTWDGGVSVRPFPWVAARE